MNSNTNKTFLVQEMNVRPFELPCYVTSEDDRIRMAVKRKDYIAKHIHDISPAGNCCEVCEAHLKLKETFNNFCIL